MNTLRSLRNFVISNVAIISLLVFVPGCSKKNEENTGALRGPSIAEVELARKIPATSSGFLLWDTSTDAFKRYRASPWGQSGTNSLMKAFEQADPTGKSNTIRPFIDILSKTGLLTTLPGQPEVLKTGIAFIDLGTSPTQKPGLGAYMSANPGQNLKDKLAQIEKVFKDEGYTTTKRSGTSEGFSIEIKATDATAPAPHLGTAYFVATENLMAIVSQEPLIERLFGASADDGMSVVRTNPAYQKTLGAIANASELSIGFLDVKATIAKLKTSLPTDSMQEVQGQIDFLPLEALAWSHQMRQGLADTIIAQVVARDDEQKRWLGILSGGSSHETLGQVPSDTVFALSFDGPTLAKIRDAALADMEPTSAAQMKSDLGLLDAIKNLSISVRGANPMSPFPEMLITASGSSASTVQTALKTAVNNALGMAGLELGAWQSKEVDGTKMEFLMSPLGVGAFQAQAGDSVVLATSESAVLDAVRASKDPSKALKGTMPATARELLSTGSLMLIYSNFERLTALFKSVEGSLAMFTGGQTGVSDEAMQELRRLGVFSASVAYSADLLRVESRYDVAPKVEADSAK